jgi:predicted ArsR family transcriptional regulator
MTKTTRQQILDLLAARQIASAADICQILHITHANTRRHLNNLESEGLVEVSGRRKGSHRGRPARQYQLASSKQENNMTELASSLLIYLREFLPPDEWQSSLARVAKILVDQTQALDTRVNLSNKLQACVNQLNQRHYNSRWEAHTDGPHLILGHCPYRQIIELHPELCQIDKVLIEQLIGSKVVQTAKLETTTLGLEMCRFLVKK